MKLKRIFCFGCGLMICFGFFLPWIEISYLGFIGGLKAQAPDLAVSGFELVKDDALSGKMRLMIAAYPVLAVIMMLAAVLNKNLSGLSALICGSGVMAYPAYQLFKLARATTGPGVWLVGAGAFLSAITGLLMIKDLFGESAAKPPSDPNGAA